MASGFAALRVCREGPDVCRENARIAVLANRTSSWIIVAFAVVIFGFSAVYLADLDRLGDLRTALAEPFPVAEVKTDGLESRLRAFHAEAHITRDQDQAWQAFVRSMLRLEEMTDDYRKREAAGERIESGMEAARHALIFGTALSEIEEKLSREQWLVLRRQIDDLSSSFTCKGIPRT